MAILTGVITNSGREALAKGLGFVGGFYANPTFVTSFKMGERGYVESVNGRIPKTPDPARTDIEADGTPGTDYFIQKVFTADDIVFLAPSTIQFRCRLVASEANDDGAGGFPKFYEIGLFDSNGIMLCYATFDEQTKNPTKILTNYVQIYL